MKGKWRLRTLASLAAALVAAALMTVVSPPAAQAAETADWLPFRIGSGVVLVGCTWDNTCNAGYHNPTLGPAIDFIAPVGTEVFAAGPGTVSGSYNSCDPTDSAGCSGGRGNYVEITHPDGRHSRYLHLKSVVVGSGAVSRGQLIGYVGNSGGSPVAHLHYDETVNGNKVDPGKMIARHDNNLVQYPNVLNSAYTDWTKVPAWSGKYVHNESFGAPDPDDDGFSGNDDLCPDIWGKYRGCPLKSDYNADGKDDVASFYRHDNNLTNLVRWNGQSNLYTSGAYAPWSLGGFDATRLLPAGSGNFDGDRYQDIAAFFRHDNGMIDLDIWYGNANGGMAPGIAWHQDAGWEGDRLIPVGAADFNDDDRTDVAAFYRYDNNFVNLYVWYGQANDTLSGPFIVWSGNGWDGNRIVPVGSGDIDGDGKPDIATFYRHDNGMVDYNVWYGNGGGAFTLYRPWTVGSGWDASRFVPAGVADLDSDGRLEAIVFFRHDNNLVDMRVWRGTASRVTGEPGGPWSGSGWDGSRILPAGTGDYNGDGKADVATFYRHDGQVVDMNIWYGNGNGGMSLFRAWNATSDWEGDRLVPVKG